MRVVDADELLEHVYRDKLEEQFKNTNFYNEENSCKYYDAMQHGLIWATTLMASSGVLKYYTK